MIKVEKEGKSLVHDWHHTQGLHWLSLDKISQYLEQLKWDGSHEVGEEPVLHVNDGDKKQSLPPDTALSPLHVI